MGIARPAKKSFCCDKRKIRKFVKHLECFFPSQLQILSQTQTQIQIQLATELFLERSLTNTDRKTNKKAAKFSQQRERKNIYKYKRVFGRKE